MAYTIGQMAALEAAIASGVKEVQYRDQLTRYQSTEAMRAVLAEMRRELGVTPAAARTTFASTRKGV